MLRPDWPRPDLNLACLELLIGLTYLALPPRGADDRNRLPLASVVDEAMARLEPAFNLLGDGPRFLQDLDPLEGDARSPDMLFIDSAGASTARKNADLMVRRERYEAISLPLAAIALYTLQAFAPSGGAGNRTSMRGGGPMVTLVKPSEVGLWPLIWANVPRGDPLPSEDLVLLPWMRPTRESKPILKKAPVTVPRGDSGSKTDPEMFFGQPRRLRLVARNGAVTQVIQKPWGTNYSGWRHPLTPYYRRGDETLAVHPKPGAFGYRNWRGIILQSESGSRATNLMQYLRDVEGARCSLIVAGWAMDNMKPLDFLWSEQPVFPLSGDCEDHASDAVEAAEQAGFVLAARVCDGVGDKISGAGSRAREAFFATTQGAFEKMLEEMSLGQPFAPSQWVERMREAAISAFDAEVLPGLADLSETRRRKAVNARSMLIAAFSGQYRSSKKIFDPLGLEVSVVRAKNGEVR